MIEKSIQDNELGEIIWRISPRAKYYSIKISRGNIVAIMPQHGDEKRLWNFIQENREKIRKTLDKRPTTSILNEHTKRQTATFKIHICRARRDNFYMQLKDGILLITCPIATNFTEPKVQRLLIQFIERALRHEAHKYLPIRLSKLAQEHGFSYTGIKIFNSKTRWGSCSSKRSINLSLSLMLLPWHLIDYVLLHELCHTQEFNHSKQFWNLMKQVTNGKALLLREELKQHHML